MQISPVFKQVFISFAAFHLVIADVWAGDWTSFPLAGEASIAYDHFRSLPDGSWNGNTGAYVGLNLATEVPCLSCFGIQLGGSYGIYDWTGRASVPEHQNEVQQQAFLTVGIFRRTPCDSGFNFGVVYDWTANKNLGAFALNPNFDQVRFQVGYLMNCSDEFGFWGTAYLSKAHKTSEEIPVTFRAFGQANLFWKHYFANCAWTMVWAGVPYNRGLMFAPGRDGQFLVGASFNVPLTQCLSISGHAMYMRPRSGPAYIESINDAVNICFGLTYAFGNGEASECDCDVGPYMPIADNSNFITDTNLNF